MKVHVFAPWQHHLRHTMAVWKHLPEELKGEVVKTRIDFPEDDVILVGGYDGVDQCMRNRLVYVEHGAGQSYVDSKHAYAYHGSHHPERVIGYISPRHDVADSWGRPAIAVGCPALDGIKSLGRYGDTVAITFHWNARRAAPEARSAREHYQEHLHTIVAWLREQDYEVLGSSHPRDKQAAKIWRYLRVEHEPDPDEVLTKASLVIADNTSLMYEAAALGIPVIALNAPWYRREVEHGLRFWSHVPGWQANDAFELMALDLRTYSVDDPSWEQREDAAVYAYGGPIRSDSGRRAARWLTELVTAL